MSDESKRRYDALRHIPFEDASGFPIAPQDYPTLDDLKRMHPHIVRLIERDRDLLDLIEHYIDGEGPVYP